METSQSFQKIDAILNREVATNKSPSVQYALFDTDRIIHRFYSGTADVKANIPADENTAYAAFSATKTFTALAILQLAEKGLLDIDEEIHKYLPGLRYPSGITIRQIANHTSGLPNPNPLPWIHLADEHPAFDRDRFFNMIYNKYDKVKSKPNEKFAYSNLGYVILGQLIEIVSGLSYEDYIHINIIERLDFHPGSIGVEIPKVTHRAKGYQKRLSLHNALLGFFMNKKKYMDKPEDGWKPFKDLYINGTPHGGLMGTSNAFVRYLQELLRPGCSLITDEYKKILFKENVSLSNKLTGMCFSWFKGRLNGTDYFCHAGGGGGYYCEFRLYPEMGIGSLVLFNRSGFRDIRFLDKTDKWYIKAG